MSKTLFAAKSVKGLIRETMQNWNCSKLEAQSALEYGYSTLEETRNAIAKAVTYNRLLVDLLPGTIEYMKKDRYKKESLSDEIIFKEANELVESQAFMFVYQWNQVDNYEMMDEGEKYEAMFGMPK